MTWYWIKRCELWIGHVEQAAVWQDGQAVRAALTHLDDALGELLFLERS